MISKEQKKTIMESIGLADNDRYKARFFMHKQPNMENDTILQAKAKADAKAQRKTDITGKYQAPDYSPDKLIKLGAKQTYKELLYVEIKRIGAKDFRSMEAKEEHKMQFETEYNKFLSENKQDERNIREEREIIRIDTVRQDHSKTQVCEEFGGFSYSFNL